MRARQCAPLRAMLLKTFNSLSMRYAWLTKLTPPNMKRSLLDDNVACACSTQCYIVVDTLCDAYMRTTCVPACLYYVYICYNFDKQQCKTFCEPVSSLGAHFVCTSQLRGFCSGYVAFLLCSFFCPYAAQHPVRPPSIDKYYLCYSPMVARSFRRPWGRQFCLRLCYWKAPWGLRSCCIIFL